MQILGAYIYSIYTRELSPHEILHLISITFFKNYPKKNQAPFSLYKPQKETLFIQF